MDDDSEPGGFPTVRWGDDTVDFLPGSRSEGIESFAALVFPFYGDRVMLARIAGRGWCVPSGRVEPGESAEATARREAHEESGLVLGTLHLLGHYRYRQPNRPDRYSSLFIADVGRVEPFEPGLESLERNWFAVEDVAELYYARDPLLDAVFDLAWRMRDLLLPRGIRIAEWMTGG